MSEPRFTVTGAQLRDMAEYAAQRLLEQAVWSWAAGALAEMHQKGSLPGDAWVNAKPSVIGKREVYAGRRAMTTVEDIRRAVLGDEGDRP